MTLFWILLGALIAIAFGYMYQKFHIKGKMSVWSWVLTVCSILWGAFVMAWIASSLAENEMQAGQRGLAQYGEI